MKRKNTLVSSIFAICLILSMFACGGDDNESSDGLQDDALISALDAEQKQTLCTELIADNPASCWTVDNLLPTKALKDGSLLEIEQVCLDKLLTFNANATVKNVKNCYADADQTTCELPEDEICLPQNPDNMW